MKSETRVLLTLCSPRACMGVILRGFGMDGSVGGKDCRELCINLELKGYKGETRYALGDCSCGLPRPPQIPPTVMAWSRILAGVVGFLDALERGELEG